MSHSLNELEALCKKAARGAGYSWGLSEEAAKAVRWLAARGLPGPDALATLLAANDGVDVAAMAPADLNGNWFAPSGRLCPLIAGAYLSDMAASLTSRRLTDVAHPLLLVPFAALAAADLGDVLSLEWDGARLVTDASGISVTGDRTAVAVTHADVLVKKGGLASTPIPAKVRCTISPDCHARLSAFAHRTYAPASEASRLLGAGAGTSDND